MRPRITVLVAATAIVCSLPTAPAGASGYPGPTLRESPDVLAKALTCPATFSGAHEPVLLVHATTETGQRNWSSNFGRVLPKLGYDVCTVELVDEATGDIQA
jgi:triacylglycerol lipase